MSSGILFASSLLSTGTIYTCPAGVSYQVVHMLLQVGPAASLPNSLIYFKINGKIFNAIATDGFGLPTAKPQTEISFYLSPGDVLSCQVVSGGITTLLILTGYSV
jgi:hypothetical protein